MRSLSAVPVLLICLAGLGCQNVECGPNTIEKDGVCTAQTDPPGTQCGPGTYYDASSGRCLNNLVGDGGGICGANTVIVINDAGVPVCVGTGGTGTDCNQPINCPQPTEANSLSICGRIYDLEDSTPLDDGNPANGEPYRDVVLRVYDPLAFATDPIHAPIVKTGAPDSCGRFAITNIPISMLGSGFVAVTTDDAGGTDNLVLTGIADVASAGATLTGRRAWVFRRSTDMLWSNQAGLMGMTFGTRGVYIPIFVSGTPIPPFTGGGPTPGVQVASISTGGQREVQSANDYYFDDTGPLLRKALSQTRPATGANGTALFINASLNNYSGVGAEPAGTCWQKTLAASPMTAAFVQERTASSGDCP